MGVVSVAQTSGKGILHVCSLIFLIYHFCSLFCVFFLAAELFLYGNVWLSEWIDLNRVIIEDKRVRSKPDTDILLGAIVVYCTEVNKVSFFLK